MRLLAVDVESAQAAPHDGRARIADNVLTGWHPMMHAHAHDGYQTARIAFCELAANLLARKTGAIVDLFGFRLWLNTSSQSALSEQGDRIPQSWRNADFQL
jgi:hypothetical protein